MGTYRLLEELKESIKSDFRDLEQRCSEAHNKIQCLEKENNVAKDLTNQLQNENASLKKSVSRLQKELAYKDEKLKRKTEESRNKDSWWDLFRHTSERRFKAMKDYGTFPPHILEKFVNRDIDEQMKDIPKNCISLKESEISMKHRNLTTLKSKKKVRYNIVSNTRSSADEKKQKYSYTDHMQVCQANNSDNSFDENLFSDPNESTKLYQNQVPVKGKSGKVSVSDKLSVCQEILVPETEEVHYSLQHDNDKVSAADEVPVHPEILVPDTEDVYSEEVCDGLHCTIGAPSASSTPLAAANSPRFGYDNDYGNDVSIGILGGATGKSPSDDSVNLLTAAKTGLSHLPKSDSQYPVDLSYTQPQSPTIPSRTQSLQQDLNLTADCSVSLLPHGMRNEEVQSKTDFKSEQNAFKDCDDTVFINTKIVEKTSVKRDENINKHTEKGVKQTTMDNKLLKGKATVGGKDVSVGKRKREGSDENDDFTWFSESTHEEPTVFKVPVAPPPKTPEVVPLEEFPSRVTGRKSCSTPLSSSGDITGLNNSAMDQSADLFDNMDDQRSPDFHDEEKEKAPSLENSQKENVSSNKNFNTNPGYKYVEVVRKKDERAKLNGYKCRDCQEYYQGLNLPDEELKKRLKHCSRHRQRKTMHLFVLFIVFRVAMVTYAAQDPPKGLHFVGIGYNLLKANPEGGDLSTGGVDPGLLTTRKILQLTWEKNKLSVDWRFSVPDQIRFAPRQSCFEQNTTSVVFGTKSYQKELKVGVEASGGYDTGLWSVAFSLSSSYKKMDKETSKSKKVFYDETKVCNRGRVRYQLDLARQKNYPVTEEFAAAVCRLPEQYSQEKYLKFIDDWGTHVVLEVELGEKNITRYQSSWGEVTNYAMENIGNSVSVEGDYEGYSASLAVNVETFQESMNKNTKFGSYKTVLKTGGPDLPEPIKAKLMPIYEALQVQFFTQIRQRRSCVYSASFFENLTQNTKRLLRDYPSLKHATTGKDPNVRIPLAWPKGKYGLPMPKSGCPKGKGFTWHQGTRYHDTEDDDPSNNWSRPYHLAGTIGKANAQQKFCMKTQNQTTLFSLPWPKGRYCIFKKGTECPTGFNEGSIFWDDEDDDNGNSYSGALPEGTYDRNTEIFFCCRSDGSSSIAIILPTDSPFVLLRASYQCQSVKGMRVKKEYFAFDTEDDGNIDSDSGSVPFRALGRKLTLRYCYYHR